MIEQNPERPTEPTPEQRTEFRLLVQRLVSMVPPEGGSVVPVIDEVGNCTLEFKEVIEPDEALGYTVYTSYDLTPDGKIKKYVEGETHEQANRLLTLSQEDREKIASGDPVQNMRHVLERSPHLAHRLLQWINDSEMEDNLGTHDVSSTELIDIMDEARKAFGLTSTEG